MATYSSRKPAWGGQKENQQHETPMEKKRKLLGSAASGVKVRSHRSVLSVVNIRVEGSPAGRSLEAGTPSKAGMAAVIGDGSSTSAATVEALLNLKMSGKTKFDFKVIPIVGRFGYCPFSVLRSLCNTFQSLFRHS